MSDGSSSPNLSQDQSDLIYDASCPTAKDKGALYACLNDKGAPSAGSTADTTVFSKVSPAALPESPVTGNLAEFKAALAAEVKACGKNGSGSFKIRIQENGVTQEHSIGRDKWCLATNQKLLELANKPKQTFAGLMADAKKEFDWYSSNCSDPHGNGEIQVTAYHNPVYEGRSTSQGEFIYPIYATPSDFKRISYSDANGKVHKDMACREIDDPQSQYTCPYYSREEITAGHVLNNAVQADGKTPAVLAYVKSPLDVTLGQVEGSLILRDENGVETKYNYADQNGRRNYMPARILKCECVDKAHWDTVPGIRSWFAAHKNRESALLNLNPSWVFFEKASDGPYGGSGLKLTAMHSIAVDKSVYPYGLLMLMSRAAIKKSQDPGCLYDIMGNCTGYTATPERTSTLTLAEDTGGAIRGCHVDLFVGTGAEGSRQDRLSGDMNDSANMFFALPKDIFAPVTPVKSAAAD